MANVCTNEKNRICISALLLIILIIVTAVSSGALFFLYTDISIIIQNAILNWLGLAIGLLNFLGASVIVFGSILLATRYITTKLRAPLTAIDFTPRARYLIVGLEILISAEVINTAFIRTIEGFLLLILTIGTRGLIALLLHLETKWGMQK